MYNTLPDLYRNLAVDALFTTKTFNKCWETWQGKIREILGANFTEDDIINLGDHLSTIFKTTGTEGREQGELSAGGTAWESLVCWYINLCTVGTRIVAVKKMSLVPKALQDAITVNYGNFACNTESDITVIIFPDLTEYNAGINEISIIDHNSKAISAILKGKLNPNLLNHLSNKDFNRYEIGIIQCKTNWNDNAQVPMLWDMIYSANGFPGRNISIGRNGYSISALNRFTYAFATVPSNQRANYGSDSVAVKRVTNLSGGNFWGKPTTQNVSRSIKEIFNNNYLNGFRGNLRADIRAAIPYLLTDELSYFNL